jgi:hypothetical protein
MARMARVVVWPRGRAARPETGSSRAGWRARPAVNWRRAGEAGRESADGDETSMLSPECRCEWVSTSARVGKERAVGLGIRGRAAPSPRLRRPHPLGGGRRKRGCGGRSDQNIKNLPENPHTRLDKRGYGCPRNASTFHYLPQAACPLNLAFVKAQPRATVLHYVTSMAICHSGIWVHRRR